MELAALPRVSANLPPYTPNKSTLAFGARAIPKIRGELSSSDVDVVCQSLLLLAEQLHKPENITSACREGIVQCLSSLLSHNDVHVRYRSAHCLQLIAEHAIGRRAFIKLLVIPELAKLYNDADIRVRTNAHLAVEMCARTRQGVEGVIEADLVATLVDKLLAEEDIKIKVPILDTLHWCLQIDPTPGLECLAITRLQPLLEGSSSDICWRVARCVSDLTVPHHGKVTCCECNMVSTLVKLLDDNDSNVRTFATASLMNIAVITAGKYELLQEGALTQLVVLLHDGTPSVRLNAAKSITLLAEAPEGKEQLQSSLDRVKLLENDSNPVISGAAATAYNVITWKP